MTERDTPTDALARALLLTGRLELTTTQLRKAAAEALNDLAVQGYTLTRPTHEYRVDWNLGGIGTKAFTTLDNARRWLRERGGRGHVVRRTTPGEWEEA